MAIFFNEFKHLKIQLEEIKSATDNFGDNNLIGRGGFGKVYKGTISHSKGQIMAAFKRLDSALGQGNSEFWKEITMLSRYTHENLVSLLGYCDVGDEKILVYEYASRGSLDRHLSDTALTWMQRLRICLGAARGLSYLHDPKETQQRILHRDIKSSNILLDENWNAKVSDFGLSRVSPANQEHTILISNTVGTVGYLDPLYLEMGLLTKESDVYSFGVVLFEVLCGRLCYEYSNSRVQTLVRLWKKSYKQKKLDEIIFQDMFQQMDPSSLETFSDISYLCLNKSLEERPMMAHVVKELEIALDRQVTYEQRIDYAEMNRNNQPCFSGRTEVPPLIYSPKEEQEMLLSKGNLLHMDKASLFSSLDTTNSCATSSEGTPWPFHNLIEINVEFNDDVKKIIPSNELVQLQKLEKISVRYCDFVEEVFEALEGRDSNDRLQSVVVEIPKLREVELGNMMNLKYIWKNNPWMVLEFPNLTKLSIYNCRRLEHVFSSSMVGSLLQLQDLHIKYSQNMEVIVKEANVVVEEGDEEECDDKVNNEIIMLPRLKSLKLEYLPSLKGFYLGKEAFSLPSLDTLDIRECRSIRVFTKGDLATPELKLIDTSFGRFELGREDDVNSFINTELKQFYP